jgi:cyclopropane fatty-acyl-phospholipid synthase-like methyltransferase
MSLFYSVAFAIGFTPWERAGEADPKTLDWLFTREEADRGGPGRALDLGCGTGMHTVDLASRGWAVTGVDLIPKAIALCQRRIADRHVSATAIQADVTKLHADQVGAAYDLFLDVGCYQGLRPRQQQLMARGVTALAAPDATLLLLAFTPGTLPRPLPRGADQANLETTFPGWVVTDTEPAPVEGMPRPLRRAAPTWYRLRYQRSAR